MRLASHPTALSRVQMAGVAAGAVAVLAIAMLPVLTVLVPPMADYINHLARLHILATIDDSAHLQRLYAVRWRITPYVGMDAIGLLLAKLMPILWVGRVLVMLVMALFLLGAMLLHRALYGRISAWPLLAGLFLYSFPLYMGFLPYLLSAALAVVGFAVWVWGERWPAWSRLGAGALAALVAFLSHYAGIVALALCFAGYEASRWWQGGRNRHEIGPRLLAVSLPFVLPLALSLAVAGAAHAGPTTYDHWSQHLRGLRSATLYPGSRFDLAILGFGAVALAAGLATRRVVVAPALWLPVGAMMLATLVLPGAPMGLWGMQFRLPVVAAVIIAAGVRPVRAGWPEGVAAVVAGALFLGHVATIGVSWMPLDAQYRELRAALVQVPRGSRLLSFVTKAGGDRGIPRAPFVSWMHMPALAVIERDVFYPNLHKQPMMTVHATALTAPISPYESTPSAESDLWDGLVTSVGGIVRQRVDPSGRLVYWADWPRHFDMVIGLHFGADPDLPPALELVHRGSFFSLYRVVRPE